MLLMSRIGKLRTDVNSEILDNPVGLAGMAVGMHRRSGDGNRIDYFQFIIDYSVRLPRPAKAGLAMTLKSYFRKGLFAFSCAIVVAGPWPG